ncbi:hypothetical protein GCM10011391_29560 [Pullulanibacillus camelliae]|uniref:Uncharacterized protein n=1 Tax=Pullulanibacillus camelliae TaxID=1707096 RepID=A0A8J2YKM3_9BACL|nr:hypothetical protein GCM10011391_29560 [Pullulanibacillus camelliae]
MILAKEYGISNAELKRIMDQYVLKQGETMDVERLREGLEVLIRHNNEALINDIKQLIGKE